MSTSNQTQNQTQNKGEKPYVIVDFLDLDTSKISFQAPKANTHGGHFIPIKYDGKALYVTYEARTCPFGVSTSNEEKPEYKGRYPDGKKVTGYSTAVSLQKEYEQDPYYQKSLEIDNFFMDACHKNAMAWHLGGTAQRPLGRDAIEGYDDRGADGKWKRMLKWSYKKDEHGQRQYLDYPPRLEFSIPTNSMTEHQGSDGLTVQEAVFKPVFFDVTATKLEPVNSTEASRVLPKWSRVATLAQWSTITQGTYGATLKPKSQQFRVFPNESLNNDECLLNGEDGEEEYDIGDQLGGFAGNVTVTKLDNTPAPLEEETEVVDEIVDEEPVEIVDEIEEPAPEPAPVVKRTVTRPTRRVVTKKN